jgi:hypothetical protein
MAPVVPLDTELDDTNRHGSQLMVHGVVGSVVGVQATIPAYTFVGACGDNGGGNGSAGV